MRYLTHIAKAEPFHALFTNGAQTTSRDAACFFTVMEERGIAPADLTSHINISELVDDGCHDWTEIKRIAATFAQAQGVAA